MILRGDNMESFFIGVNFNQSGDSTQFGYWHILVEHYKRYSYEGCYTKTSQLIDYMNSGRLVWFNAGNGGMVVLLKTCSM